MVALVLAASLQELSESLERTPFKAEYTAWRKGTDVRLRLTIQYSPPDMARLSWHTPDGDISVSTDGERVTTAHPKGSSSLSMREMAEWGDGVFERLSPRLEALANACGKPEVGPLGEPRLRIELALSRSGRKEKPFNLVGGISFAWNQPRFGWLDAPRSARVGEAGKVVRIVAGEIATEVDSETGILRSMSVVDEAGKTLARMERERLEEGKEYPRSEFVPSGESGDSRAAWRALCAKWLTSLVLSTTLRLLPEAPGAWKGETGRALEEFLAGAADEALGKLFPPEGREALARAYTGIRAPKENVLRIARVSMGMQLRAPAEAARTREDPKGALVLAWREALKRRFEERVVKPVLARLEELLSKRETPWR